MSKDVFVSRKLSEFISITEILEMNGYCYTYRVLKQEIIEANRFISEKLQVPLATKLFSYQKLRIVEDIPRSIETIYIEYDRVSGIENMHLQDTSLYSVLKNEYNYLVRRNEEEIRIVYANQNEAQLLGVPNDSEVVMVEGLSYIDTVKPLEYFQIIALPSFFKFTEVNKQ